MYRVVICFLLALSLVIAEPLPDMSEMDDATLEVSEYSIDDGSLQIRIDEETGEFALGADPLCTGSFTRLMYNLTTGFFLVYNDGIEIKSSEYMGSPDSFIATDSSLQAIWTRREGLRVELTISLALREEDDLLWHLALWSMKLTAVDHAAHDVGVCLFNDICVGSADVLDFRTPDEDIRVATLFDEASMPVSWMAFHALDSLTHIKGLVQGVDLVTPDYLWLGHWGRGAGNGWDLSYWETDTGGAIMDAAMMNRWNERSLRADSSITFTTAFGITVLYENPLEFTHIVPVPEHSCGVLEPVSFDFSVVNHSDLPIHDFYAQIDLPEGITLYGSDSVGTFMIETDSIFAGSFVGEVSSSLFGNTVDYSISCHFQDVPGHRSFREDYSMYIPDFEIPNCRIISTPEGCAEGYVCLESEVTGLDLPEYFWSPARMFDDPTIPEQTFATSVPGWVYLTVVDTNGCATVDSLYAGASYDMLTADAGEDRGIIVGESTTLGGSPTYSGGVPSCSILWEPNRYLSSPTVGNPVASPDSSIQYVLTVLDGTGNIAQDTVIVTVITGIDENHQAVPNLSQISVNPNPFNAALSISAPDGASIAIHDTQGRQIANLGKSRLWNAADDIPSGIYLVRIQSGDDVREMKAVLVR